MNSKKIGIIGAGISGLSCAQKLVAQGHQVVIFEKSRGVGGRMSHRYFEDWEADHGAQYFTAKDPIFIQEVDRWLQQGVVKVWDGQIVRLEHGQVQALKTPIPRYVGVPSMTAPAKQIASPLNLQLSQTITEIKRVGPSWQCISKENGLLNFILDEVICSLPPMQAQAIIEPHSLELSQTCSQIQMLPCWTLLAYFENPLHLPFTDNLDAAFVSDHLFSWLARDNSKPGRNGSESWVAQASNDWSLAHLELPKSAIEPLLLAGFQDLTGQICTHYQTHLWRYAKPANPGTQRFAHDPVMHLSICGDWLMGSAIESAWLSGYYLAQDCF